MPSSLVKITHTDHVTTGVHDDFCYACGSTMELIGCQTCATSYHTQCMVPAIDPNEIPPFWYCQHCVDRELNIAQPASPSAALMDPLTEVGQLYPSPTSIENSRSQSIAGLENTTTQIVSSTQQEPQVSAREARISRKENLKTIDVIQASSMSLPKSKAAGKKAKSSYSPPRKRSKYSNLSSEVDKALVVIQKELEKAAQVGKSEDVLQDRIQDLEQQLKLKDGQICLIQRELELARESGTVSGELRRQLEEVKKRNASLVGDVESKDKELRDWREKLKGLLGGEASVG